jgi:hypothetical protein
MRGLAWISLAACFFASVSVTAASAQDSPARIAPRQMPTPPVATVSRDSVIESAVDCGSRPSSGCGAASSCHRSCEAGRYCSNIPRGHCEAIAESLREIGTIALDVPYSFCEWAKKINNTVHGRGSCRDNSCSQRGN